MSGRDKEDQRRKAVAKNFIEEGVQQDMFAEDGAPVPLVQRDGPGRPAGSTNKVKSKMADYMAARGYRDPVDQLAMLAGLDRPDLHPMAYAAQIAGNLGENVTDVAKQMRQAAADLLPYYHAKRTPDINLSMPVMQVTMAPPMGGHVGTGRVAAPPPMPNQQSDAANEEAQQNQQVSNSDSEKSDSESRTE